MSATEPTDEEREQQQQQQYLSHNAGLASVFNPLTYTRVNADQVDSVKTTHFYEYINPYKIADLKFTNGVVGSGGTDQSLLTSWGNWRTAGNNPEMQVDSRVLLSLDSQKLGFSIRHQFDKAFEGMFEKGGLSKIEGLLETARILTAGSNQSAAPIGGRFKSKFANVPAWKHTDPLSFNGDLSFNFQFGQSGIYNAVEEVVKPILAIVSRFALNSLAGQGNENYLTGPAPTMNYYVTKMFSSIVSGLGPRMTKALADAGKATSAKAQRDAGETNDDATPFSSAINTLTEVQQAMYKAIDNGILSGMDRLRLFFVRLGNYVAGPFVASNISWNFDFEQTDSNGAPWKGNVTISGIESIYHPTRANILTIYEGQRIRGNDDIEDILLPASAERLTFMPNPLAEEADSEYSEADQAIIQAARTAITQLRTQWYDTQQTIILNNPEPRPPAYNIAVDRRNNTINPAIRTELSKLRPFSSEFAAAVSELQTKPAGYTGSATPPTG